MRGATNIRVTHDEAGVLLALLDIEYGCNADFDWLRGKLERAVARCTDLPSEGVVVPLLPRGGAA